MAVTWEDVVTIATRFPGVAETTSHGAPSLKVGRRFLARVRTDPDAIVLVTTDLEEKEALLAGQPEAFFTTPHYDGYPAVLVRPERAERTTIEELVEDAWRTHALKKHLKELAERG